MQWSRNLLYMKGKQEEKKKKNTPLPEPYFASRLEFHDEGSSLSDRKYFHDSETSHQTCIAKYNYLASRVLRSHHLVAAF